MLLFPMSFHSEFSSTNSQITSAQLAVTYMHGSIMKGEILETDFASLKSQQEFYEHLHKMEVSSESNDDATSQPVVSLIDTTISFPRSEHVCGPLSNPLSNSSKTPQLSTSDDRIKASACELKTEESQQEFYEHLHKMEVSSEFIHNANSQPVMSHMETTISSTRSEHVCDPLSNPLSDSSNMPQLSTSNYHVKDSACELKAEESYLERPQSSNSDSSHTIDPINKDIINQTTNIGNRIGHQLNSSKTNIISVDSYKQSSPKYRLLDINSKFEPSDIVKSILAKPSVFDEDTKRLEYLYEKYVPNQLNLPRISFDNESIYHTPISSSLQFMPSSSVSLLPQDTIITNDQPYNIETYPTDSKFAPVDLSRSLTGMRELFSTHQNINDWSDSTVYSKYFSPNNSVSSGEDDAQTTYNGNTSQVYTKNWLDSLEGSNEKTCQLRGISDYQRLSGFRGEEKLNEKQISKQSSSVQFSGERKRPRETIVHSSPSIIGIQEKKTNESYFKKPSEQKNIVKSVHESVSTISDKKKTCDLPFKKRAKFVLDSIKQNSIDPDHVEVQKSGPEFKKKGSTSKECKIIKNQLFDFNMFETNINKNIYPSKNFKSKNIEKKIGLLKMDQKPETINEDKRDTINKTYKKDNVSKLKEKSLDELGTDFSTSNIRKTRSSSRLNDLNKSNIDKKNSEGNNKKNCSFSKISDSKNKINSLEKISKKKKVNKKLLNEEVGSTSISTSVSKSVLDQPYVSMYDKVKARSSRGIRK